VTPRIGEQGTVALDVKQEVNEVGENEPPPINSPRFTKREAETSVVLLNNQTLVLGGLIQNKRTRIHIGVPWLSRIPILGYLFGSVENKIEKKELLGGLVLRLDVIRLVIRPQVGRPRAACHPPRRPSLHRRPPRRKRPPNGTTRTATGVCGAGWGALIS
jgi:Flp pilus assembly secretin CpaC